MEPKDTTLDILEARDRLHQQQQQKHAAEFKILQDSVDAAITKLVHENHATFIARSANIGVTANGQSLIVGIAAVTGNQLCLQEETPRSSRERRFEPTGFEVKGLETFADGFVSLPRKQCINGPEYYAERDTYRFTHHKRLYLVRRGGRVRLFMRVDLPEGRPVIGCCMYWCGSKSSLQLYRVPAKAEPVS